MTWYPWGQEELIVVHFSHAWMLLIQSLCPVSQPSTQVGVSPYYAGEDGEAVQLISSKRQELRRVNAGI